MKTGVGSAVHRREQIDGKETLVRKRLEPSKPIVPPDVEVLTARTSIACVAAVQQDIRQSIFLPARDEAFTCRNDLASMGLTPTVPRA